MASNSPGSVVLNDSQEYLTVSGLQTDVTDSPGRFQLSIASSFQRDAGLTVRDSGYMSTSDGASTCSSSTAEMCDLEGGTLLLLESKSLRSFVTNDEYLLAMKEDLAEWFSSLYQNNEITADNFFGVLETGVLLCKHANKVQEVGKQQRELGETLEMRSYFIRCVPEGNVPYKEGVKPETFQARDNISNFISWTRRLGIPEVLRFETDDLVLRKNEKSVILCLLEVARVGAKLGMLAPTLVQMEEEIDAELAGEEPPPRAQIQTCDLRSLDERVRDLISRCTCPVQFPMVKVSDGKYKIGDTKSLIFVRILRNHVMVRVGGGWDTLENYLNKHDPCQCNYRGHRAGAGGVTHKVGQQRRSSNAGNNVFQTSNTPVSQRVVSSVVNTSRNRSASPQNPSRSNSPSFVISRNIPSSSKTTSSSASKGVHVPGEKQQEFIAGTWPNLPSKSGDLIRSNSPSPSHLRTPSPLTALPQTTPSSGKPYKTTSSALLNSRKDPLESTVKNVRRTSAFQSVNSNSEEYLAAHGHGCFDEGGVNADQDIWESRSDIRSASLTGNGHMMTQTSHLQGALELTTSPNTNSMELSSAAGLSELQNTSIRTSGTLAEHSKTFGHSQTEAWNSVTETDFPETEMSSKSKIKLMDFKKSIQSATGAKNTMRRNSLPHVSGVSHGLLSAAVTHKQKDNKAFRHVDDKTKVSTVSNSKTQPLTQRTASPQITREVSPLSRKATDNRTKIRSAQLLKEANKDPMLQAASANLERPESPNEAHMKDISFGVPNNLSQSETVAHSSSHVPKSSANEITGADYIPISPQKGTLLISPQTDPLGSTARERPASSSRIPKPCFSRPSIPRTPLASGSKYDSKENTSLPKLSTQKNICHGGISSVSGKTTLVSSKSNNSLSSVKSSDETPLSTNSSICNESLNTVKSVVHNTNISDNLHGINSNSAVQTSEHVFSEEDVEIFDQDPTQLSKLNEKLPEGNSTNSVFGHSDIPDGHQRNTCGTTTQPSPVDILKPALDTTNIKLQQDIIINDITFSDDEEVNELIKNIALKQKETARSVQSKGSGTKKHELQKSSRNSIGSPAVQHEDKHESFLDSESVQISQSSASSKDFLTYEKGHTKSSSSNDTMFENNMALLVESKDLEKNITISTSGPENSSFSRTEAWVDSTLPGTT